jgi:hypothetical protein
MKHECKCAPESNELKDIKERKKYYRILMDLTEEELINLKFRLERNLKLTEMAIQEKQKYPR